MQDHWIIRVSRAVRHILYMILLNLNSPCKVEISPSLQVRKLRFRCVEHPSEIPAHGDVLSRAGCLAEEIFDSETFFSGTD